LQESSAIQTFIADHAVQAGRPIRLRMQMLGFDAVCRMVESSAGIAIVPESSAVRAAVTMAVRIVSLSDSWAERDLRVCIKSEARLPPVASQLVAHLREFAATATGLTTA